MTTTLSIDARELSVGDVYAFRHAGLQWRRVVRVRQVTMQLPGLSLPATEVLHGRLDHPGDLLTVNYPHGGKVTIET